MSEDTFTVIDEDRPRQLKATVDGDRVRLSADELERALGWELTPEGLCREGLCVPRGTTGGGDGIELSELAQALDRPLAIDADERVAVLGARAADRAGVLASLTAPDFSLPDLEGRLHSLSEHRGTKVFLVAYASW
jgi:hypothetical protein